MALHEPADVEPDLVLVLGSPTRLPPSLVWESWPTGELAFEPITPAELRPGTCRRSPSSTAASAARRPLTGEAGVTRQSGSDSARFGSGAQRDAPVGLGARSRGGLARAARTGTPGSCCVRTLGEPPHRRAPDRAEYGKVRCRQGRAQDVVSVRGPAEPLSRPAAAVPGRSWTSSPGRAVEPLGPCWPPRRRLAGHGGAGGRRPARAEARAPAPELYRMLVGVLRTSPSDPVRWSCRRSTLPPPTAAAARHVRALRRRRA